MKSVSNAYKASMKSLLRNRSYVKIAFSNVDTTASTDGSWTSNGAMAFSEFTTVDYAYAYGNTYATLELNRWCLDGSNNIRPTSNYTDGFISNKISTATGSFSTAAVITRAFSVPHAFPGVTLTFDTRTKEHPLSITVDFYLNSSVVDTQTVAVTGQKVIVNSTAAQVDKIIVTFGDCLPYRRPRLENILYGVEKEFTNEDIVQVKQSHDVDPLSRRLPNETMSFTIIDLEHEYDPDNPLGIYAYVDEKSPVVIQYGYELPNGTVEWLKADKYLLDSKPTAKNNQATFKGTGLIGSLTDIYYKSALGTKSFYNMAESVLLDAGLTLTEHGTNPWAIDASLQSMYTTAVLPITTHMNCLQLIAHACGCRLFTDDDNVIHIKPFGVTAVGIYSGDWSDNGHDWYSEWATVDKGNASDNTYITLELNRWTLDGSNQVPVEDSAPTGRGYISSAMSGSSGNFSTAPMFTKTFDVTHDLPVIALRFDTVLNEYPRSIRVRYYHDSTLLDTQTVSVTAAEVFVNSLLAIDCTSIDVTMYGGCPYRRMRVQKVYYRETDFTLDFGSIAKNSQSVTKIDQLKAVTVARYSQVVDNAATTTLYEGTTTDTRLHVEFSGLAQNVQITVTGGTLVSSSIYGRAADLVLSSGTKTVTITGITLTEGSVVVSYPVNATGETDVVENALVTTETMANTLAAHIAAYLQMRVTYDASYRGNPEMEVGDIIGLQTQYTDEIDALILTDEITFTGSLSGKLKVKGLI